MPVVSVKASYEWLVSPGCGASSREQALLRDILAQLPGIVINAVNGVDGSAMDENEVIILADHYHPLSKNVPDVWLDIQPELLAGGPLPEDVRRTRIAEAVHRALRELLERRSDKRPSYDIEVRPLSGSGLSVGRQGHITQRWGVPASTAARTNGADAPAGAMPAPAEARQ
ncbi:hypothetical protein JNJ66_06000 [Candidatus Saccharibacteria bacterium]|nr:hypothetical protein [Candidatus Saccharibacteria bacterium]